MKKLIALFLGFAILSCSSEDQVSKEVSAVENSASVLDGKMLSFKNEELFVKEYSGLATLNTSELKDWTSSKKFTSLLTTSDDSASMEEDVLSETRIIYSDALKSILNSESKVKISGNVLWLNERTFYLLTENQINKTPEQLVSEKQALKVYGNLLSLSGRIDNSTARPVLPNENRIRTFASSEMNQSGSRLRHVVDLYNETVVLNDQIYSSKMFIRSTLQYRSCSTWRCTWKEAGNLRNLTSNFIVSSQAWSNLGIYTSSAISGAQTFLISNWRLLPPPAHPDSQYPNFVISGPLTCSIFGVAPVPSVSIDISWY